MTPEMIHELIERIAEMIAQEIQKDIDLEGDPKIIEGLNRALETVREFKLEKRN